MSNVAVTITPAARCGVLYGTLDTGYSVIRPRCTRPALHTGDHEDHVTSAPDVLAWLNERDANTAFRAAHR